MKTHVAFLTAFDRLTYSWSCFSLMSANGSTAMDFSGIALPAGVAAAEPEAKGPNRHAINAAS